MHLHSTNGLFNVISDYDAYRIIKKGSALCVLLLLVVNIYLYLYTIVIIINNVIMIMMMTA